MSIPSRSPLPSPVALPAQPISPELFAPFGQLITACADGAEFGPGDAQLELSGGIPRFYIMELRQRGRRFHQITRHRRCTQCLGAIANQPWLIAVAPPGPSDAPRPRHPARLRDTRRLFHQT